MTTIVVKDPVYTVITAGQQGPQGPIGPAGAGAVDIQLEMGATLTKGTPLYVSGNKFYAADNVANYRVIGLLSADANITELGTATVGGQLLLTGLSPGSPYFLGSGIITATAPGTGFVVRIGQAITSTILSVSIEEPVLLS